MCLYRLFLIIFLLAIAMSFSSLIYFLAIIYILLLWRFRTVRFELKILITLFQFLIIIFGSFLLAKLIPEMMANLDISGFWSRRIRSLFEEIQMMISGNWRYSSNSLEWSNRVRLVSIFENLKIFVSRPIFGFGVGSVTSHGSTAMLLSGGGIISTLLWVKFNFLLERIKISYEYVAVILVFLLVNIFNSLSLRPFFDISAIVFSSSMIVIFSLKEKKIEKV